MFFQNITILAKEQCNFFTIESAFFQQEMAQPQCATSENTYRNGLVNDFNLYLLVTFENVKKVLTNLS